MRCSGGTPCEACILYHEECVQSDSHDRRRPASKQYVSALEERVKELEALLAGKVDTEVIPPAARSAPADEEEVPSVGIEQLKVRRASLHPDARTS